MSTVFSSLSRVDVVSMALPFLVPSVCRLQQTKTHLTQPDLLSLVVVPIALFRLIVKRLTRRRALVPFFCSELLKLFSTSICHSKFSLDPSRMRLAAETTPMRAHHARMRSGLSPKHFALDSLRIVSSTTSSHSPKAVACFRL
eukprot:2486869-Rhodomonas_salina.2